MDKPALPSPRLGQRIAIALIDAFASWWFLLCFAITLFSWIAFNSNYVQKRPFDPYPYILLNLVLSCIAAVQAPIIMIGNKLETMRSQLTADLDLAVDEASSREIAEMRADYRALAEQHASQTVILQELQTSLAEIKAEIRGTPNVNP